MRRRAGFRGRAVAVGAATAVMAPLLGFIPMATAALPVTSVYDAVLDTLPPNLVSQPFQAQQTAEFGDHIGLAGDNRDLQSAKVTMSTWAKHSEYPTLPSTGWQHPITLTIYNVDRSGAKPAAGVPIGTVTQTMSIPWRAEDTGGCAVGRWSPDGEASTNCFGGRAFNISFNLSSIATVPDEFIYGIAYNTQSYGSDPMVTAGPYNSLNVALVDTTIYAGQPETGTDVDPGAVFWNTLTAAWYADGGTGGTGTFRRDTGWAPYTPAIQFMASANGCSFTTSGTTLTLQGDCQTDQTIQVPHGVTLDGNSHTITAVDPAGGHFLGAVVANAGSAANVRNLTVTGGNLANVCDGGADRLRGILFDDASGSITNNRVTSVRQGLSGCQEGNAIEVRNFESDGDTPGSPRRAVVISGNTVSDYQKNGITANGGVTATITGNTVTGDGPITYIAQNGIQVGFGASGTVKGNTASGNNYTPTSFEACGTLLYQAGGVKASGNTLFANERDQCNYGKGGGKVKPTV